MIRLLKALLLLVVGVIVVYGGSIGYLSWEYRCYNVELGPELDAPPMPDCSENNKTLSGIDTGNNGVRDDIQRYIASIETDNDFFKRALQQYAKAQRTGIVESGDSSKAQLNFSKVNLALDCALSASIRHKYLYIESISEFNKNTFKRRFANNSWNSKLNTQLVPSLSSEDSCDFDVNKFEGNRWK